MTPKASKVPGMAADRSFVIPVCADCGLKCQKNDQGEWFCAKCADDWLRTYIEAKSSKSSGGVVLPRGVKDGRKRDPSFSHLMPNRRARRAMRRRAR